MSMGEIMATENTPAEADEPETGRNTDPEVLAMQRMVRAMEKLGDQAASRISHYLWMRYAGQTQGVRQ